MATATVVRMRRIGTSGVPEVKIEGVPYQSAKPGRPEDSGCVVVEMSVTEAEAVLSALGKVTGNATYPVYQALYATGIKPELYHVTEDGRGISHIRLEKKPTA